MAKVKTSFVCRSCGSVFPRWLGRCPDCGQWDSLEEHRADASATKDPQRGLAGTPQSSAARPLAEVFGSGGDPVPRLPTGIGELDRVLGGERASGQGLVPGSVVLVGGEPGIGKSTLMLQAAGALAHRGSRVLYVSSEESATQVAQRASRLGVGNGSGEDGDASSRMFLLADTNLARIIEQVRLVKPDVVVLDSVQMVYKSDLDASPGSVSQLRRCAAELVFLAKGSEGPTDDAGTGSGPAVLMVGHVTKEGQLAGPRLLEHLVDAVISFEGDRHHAHRLVRAVKNRFGTTQELGIFEMTGTGLSEIPEGASVAAAEHSEPRPGAIVCPVLSGSRCVLAEVQALTATGFLGAAKRKSSGLDTSRLAMLIAVLEQHADLRLADRDVFAQSVGGLRVQEPAADLAIALAIAGAHMRRSLDPRTVAVGEVGLGGEARAVPQLEHRLREAARLGYSHALVPSSGMTKDQASRLGKASGLELVGVRDIGRAVQLLG
ncbi:MAG: DNA repair protein RadA [Planctomycetota bacterium]